MEAGTVMAILLIVLMVVGSGTYYLHNKITNKGMSTHGFNLYSGGGKRRKNYTRLGSLVVLVIGSLVLVNVVNKENLLY